MNPIIEFRRALHQHPELSGEEHQTRQRVREFFSTLPGFALHNVAETGLLAVWISERPGPRVLIRAELDALPIQETGKLPHRSRVPGVAHLCGHDGHTAILCQLAQYLQEQAPQKGEVVLCFQPAEETGAGAQQVLDDEVFRKFQPDWAFALHNLPGYPLGSVVVKEGTFTAAVKSLVYHLNGKTAHAGEPEQGRNPAWMLAKVLPELQALNRPNPDKANFCLITPVHLWVGEKAYGTAPGQGELHLTIRSFSNEDMEQLHRQIDELLQAHAARHQLGITSTVVEPFEANQNDPKAVKLIQQAAQRLGLPLIPLETPFRWGEDFGYFSSRIPGAMFGLGAGEQQAALHHPDYDFPDELLPTGAKLFEAIINRILD